MAIGSISTKTNMRVWVAGEDDTADVASIDNISTPRATLEIPTINKAAMERIFGHADAAISARQWFNDGVNASFVNHKSVPTGDRLVMCVVDDVVGGAALGLTMKGFEHRGNREDDGALSFAIEMRGSETLPEWGEILLPRTSMNASTNGTSKDDAASSANGLAAYIELRTLTGADAPIKIQDSTDDAVWADLVAFTNVTADPASERVTVAGTVNRYLRVVTGAGFTSASFTIMYRRGTAVDDVAYT